MSEVFINSREKLQVEFSEIVLSEGQEPLTSGPCRLVAPISWNRLQEPVSSGRLTFLEVYIAKIFEVTIRDSTLPSGECIGGIGSSNGLNWSIFAGDSEGSRDGQKLVGNYSVPRKLACEKAEEYGLAAPESTLLNQFGIGTTQVAIPVLGIFGDEKIDKWKQFVKLFLANFAVKVNTEELMFSIGKALQDPIDNELEDCLEKNPSTSGQLTCLRRAYNQRDEELNRIYQELRQKLDSQDQEILKAAQLKWVEYRDREFELIDAIYSGQGGSMQLVFNAARRVAVVKTRVSELHRYMESIEQVDSEDFLSEGIFIGISEQGDFQEALADAVQNAKNYLKTSLVAWKLNGISGENGGFTQVNKLSVIIDASSSLEEKSEALFRFTDGETDFVFKLIESEKIVQARRILNGQEKTRVHVGGTLVKEAADYNPGWSFHLQPESIDFFEIAIEVCDASINFVEQNLSEIGNSTLPNYHWCPWSSKIVEELR